MGVLLIVEFMCEGEKMRDTTFVLQKICKQIALSDTAKETVVREYKALGELITNSDRITSDVDVKPQGSYNLGTAIKPLNGSDDDFDIDLVAVIHGSLNAAETKHSVGDVLKSSSLYAKKLLPEKNRAWTIKYQDSHVDVVPGVDGQQSDIMITNRIDKNTYRYRQSSPFEFKTWFMQKGQDIYQNSTFSKGYVRAEVEAPEEYKEYTILQEVVQLLKYHRNKMFEKRDDKLKPISMIVTILAAKAYTGQDDLSDALVSVVNGLREQIEYDLNENPHIFNPTNNSEDFTDKWQDHPERKDAFFEWLRSVESDLGTTNQTEIMQWHERLSNIYGANRVQNAFEALGERQSEVQRQGRVSLNSNGVFEGDTSEKKVRPHTYWGD